MTISLKTSQKQIWPKSKIFKNTQNSTTIFIFETPFGFLTQSAMPKKKIGAIFICSICF
jgi:ribosomal protein S8